MVIVMMMGKRRRRYPISFLASISVGVVMNSENDFINCPQLQSLSFSW